jgi:hypothetical protein
MTRKFPGFRGFGGVPANPFVLTRDASPVIRFRQLPPRIGAPECTVCFFNPEQG